MDEIKEWQGSLSRDWLAASTHLQAGNEDGRKVLRAEALVRSRSRARLLPAGNPHEGLCLTLAQSGGGGAFQRRAQAFLASK